MSDEPIDLVYRYDPVSCSEKPPKPLGVENGWVVIWDGTPGPAQVAKAGLLHEGDGSFDVVLVEDFTECTVVDDT